MEQETVPVTSLSVPELSRLREQLQADVEHLVESHGALGRAVARAEAAGRTVGTVAESKQGWWWKSCGMHCDHHTCCHHDAGASPMSVSPPAHFYA